MGSVSQIALAVLESFSSAEADTCPAVIRIARAIEPSLGSGSDRSQGETADRRTSDGERMADSALEDEIGPLALRVDGQYPATVRARHARDAGLGRVSEARRQRVHASSRCNYVLTVWLDFLSTQDETAIQLPEVGPEMGPDMATPFDPQMIVGALPMPGLLLRLDDTVVAANQPGLAMFAREGTLVIGSNFKDVVRDTWRSSLARALDEVKRAGRAERISAGLNESEPDARRSEEHTSELQSLAYLVCRLLLEKKKKE